MKYCGCSNKNIPKLFEITYENSSSSLIHTTQVLALNKKYAMKNIKQIKKPSKIRIISVEEVN